MSVRIGIVGFGKIARDQHVRAIAETAGLELVAIASRNATLDGVRNYPSIEEMLAGEPALDAVALCQPPQARFEAACTALRAGKHVFLEKPPGATISEVEALIALAKENRVTLFASWHSRFAAGVAAAKSWMAERAVRRIAISWKEDVRHWHPGQEWIWAPGGFGVFDPGINALSILTEIVRPPIRLIEAELETPSNRQAPIAARLRMVSLQGAPIEATFDFRQTGQQTWDIEVETDRGAFSLEHGGNRLVIDGIPRELGPEREYAGLYARFVDLVRAGHSDVDLAPLRLVADAFLRGRNCLTDPFES
jgi:D-galactose 1-dehydrogenase